MTDAEKVEKLAKWMGWEKYTTFNATTGKGTQDWFSKEHSELIANLAWNPRTNIADAWMLVERAIAIAEDDPKAWNELNMLGGFLINKTATNAARAISDAVLEVIE